MAISDSTTHCIYRIVCFPTGKVYVGQTKNPKTRQCNHFNQLKTNTHFNPYLQAAFNKYGRGSFYFEVLEKGISRTDVDERERYWVAHFDSFNSGYNLTVGGETISQSSRKPCTWNGVEYESVVQAATAIGVTRSCMGRRVQKGYISDTDLKHGHVKLKPPFRWNGIEYQTIAEAAAASGIQQKAMHKLLKRGHSQDAELRRFPKKGCLWNGVTYQSMSEASSATGIPRTTLRRWLEKQGK